MKNANHSIPIIPILNLIHYVSQVTWQFDDKKP